MARHTLAEVERAIAEVWCDLLNVDNVDGGDSFFDLGGSSLLAMRASMALRELASELGKPLPTVKIFEFPTVSELALYLMGQANQRERRETSKPKVVARRQRRRTLRQARTERSAVGV